MVLTLRTSLAIGIVEVLDLTVVLSNGSEVGLKWGEMGGVGSGCSLLLGAGGVPWGVLSGHLASPLERDSFADRLDTINTTWVIPCPAFQIVSQKVGSSSAYPSIRGSLGRGPFRVSRGHRQSLASPSEWGPSSPQDGYAKPAGSAKGPPSSPLSPHMHVSLTLLFPYPYSSSSPPPTPDAHPLALLCLSPYATLLSGLTPLF